MQQQQQSEQDYVQLIQQLREQNELLKNKTSIPVRKSSEIQSDIIKFQKEKERYCTIL